MKTKDNYEYKIAFAIELNQTQTIDLFKRIGNLDNVSTEMTRGSRNMADYMTGYFTFLSCELFEPEEVVDAFKDYVKNNGIDLDAIPA